VVTQPYKMSLSLGQSDVAVGKACLAVSMSASLQQSILEPHRRTHIYVTGNNI